MFASKSLIVSERLSWQFLVLFFFLAFALSHKNSLYSGFVSLCSSSSATQQQSLILSLVHFQLPRRKRQVKFSPLRRYTLTNKIFPPYLPASLSASQLVCHVQVHTSDHRLHCLVQILQTASTTHQESSSLSFRT